MTVSYFVFYRGRPEKSEEFVARYRDVHVPILSAWPGIQSVFLHRPVEWTDTQKVRPAELALAAQMTFANEQELSRALASDQRAIAREDFYLFPKFDGDVFHQAMKTEKLK